MTILFPLAWMAAPSFAEDVRCFPLVRAIRAAVGDGTVTELVCIEEWTSCEGAGRGGPRVISRPIVDPGQVVTTRSMLDAIVASYNDATEAGLTYEVSSFQDGSSTGWLVAPLGVTRVVDAVVSVDAASATTVGAAERELFDSLHERTNTWIGHNAAVDSGKDSRARTPNAVTVVDGTLLSALRAIHRPTDPVPIGWILEVYPSPPYTRRVASHKQLPIVAHGDPLLSFPDAELPPIPPPPPEILDLGEGR